jgi:hypothetical protein
MINLNIQILSKGDTLLKLLAMLILISTSAHASFREVKGLEKEVIIKQSGQDVFEYMEALRRLPAEPDCYMPHTRAMGVVFVRNGNRFSREFFFGKTSSSAMTNRIYVNDTTGTIAIDQSWVYRSNVLFIKYTNKKVAHVTFIVDADSPKEVTVDCGVVQ